MASRIEVFPAPLSPVMRLSVGPGASVTWPNRRNPPMSSRVTRTRHPAQSRTPGPSRAFASVPRGTQPSASEPERHHHVSALLVARLADEGGGVGVAQLEDHLLVAQRRQRI